MISKKVRVGINAGLHLRPAGVLCKKAMEYESSIRFVVNTVNVNAKSVLSVLSACVAEGAEIELICDGPDEEAAMEAMTKICEKGEV